MSGTNTSYKKMLVAPLLLVLFYTSCGEESECGPGTYKEDGVCVAQCPEGSEREEATGACIAPCLPGTSRDQDTGACLPDFGHCSHGTIWDGQACIDPEDICAEGTIWVASERACISTAELRPADQLEGEGENDPHWGGADAHETFLLPAEGQSWTMKGNVAKPRDRNDNGLPDADYDFWVFETDGPTLIRVEADGIGGTAAGFQLAAYDSGLPIVRLGFGTTSTSVVRDLFVPRKGRFAFIVTDALNLALRDSGPFQGGPTFGYYFTVTNLPLPAPTPLELDPDDEQLQVFGEWPLVQEAGDPTSLRFYSFPAEARSLYFFELRSNDIEVLPILTMVDSTELGLFFHNSGQQGFAESEQVLLVADYVYAFTQEDSEHRLTIGREPLTWIEEVLPPRVVEQDDWGFGEDFPWQYFGLEMMKGDVATLHLSSSTGQTCFMAWGFVDWILGEHGCHLGEPAPSGVVRFSAPTHGFYGVDTADFQDAVFSEDGRLLSIPAHSYTVEMRVQRQTPMEPEIGEGGWSVGEESLNEEIPEHFYRLNLAPGDAVLGELHGENWSPIATFYAHPYGPLNPSVIWQAPTFAWRSVDGRPLLLGVREEDGRSAEYDLVIRSISIEDMGRTQVDTPASAASVIRAGEIRHVLSVGAAEPGLLRFSASPPPGVDIFLVPRAADMLPLRASIINAQGPGGSETFDRIVVDGELIFDVALSGGQGRQSDTEITIDVQLDPFTQEVEPNNNLYQAQHLSLPAAVVGSVERGDDDVFRIEISAPSELRVELHPYGHGELFQTELMVQGGNHQILATGTMGNAGVYRQITGLQILEPGGYFVQVVGTSQQIEAGYLLEITASPL